MVKINEMKKDILFLIIAGISLLLSIFKCTLFSIDLAWIAIILCGIPIIKEAVEGLVTEFDIKADVLVSIALIASVFIGEIFAAGEVAFIMQLGSLLEELTVAKARAGIEKLVHLTPQTARKIIDDKEVIIDVHKVLKNDILHVLPGETIPVDGVIIEGETSINQAVMTGESIPVDKTVGDNVSSGTVNQFGSFKMKALKVGEDSAIQKMIKLVQSADANKAKIVGFADHFATWVVIIALSAALLTWLISGQIIRAVTILVVFCPCSLVLATPTAIMAAIGNATKHGFLVREGDALERLSHVARMTFDKTGTLTNGHLMVAEILPHQEVSQTELLQIAASVETISSHVLARSLVTYAIDKGLEMLSGSDAQEITANGVQALIQGKLVKVGKRKFVTGDPLIPSQTHTAIYVSRDDQYLGCITFTDYLRPEASQTMVQLHHLGVKKLMMLSGDQVKTAQKIGQEVGIDDVQAELLPEDKIAALKALTPEEKPVVMVGDGVNDAPSLVTADVGIAMGAHGSSAASESADLVILKDDLAKVAKAVVIAKDTIRVARQAVLIGIFICTALMLIAAFGIIPAFIGAMFQEVIDTVSILWALRARYSNEK